MPLRVVPLPPALEHLRTLDQMIVYQTVELIQALKGFDTNNKYVVITPTKQQIFFMAEESSFWTRLCCCANRGFKMHVLDNYGAPVMQFQRPGYFCFCDGIMVYSPSGKFHNSSASGTYYIFFFKIIFVVEWNVHGHFGSQVSMFTIPLAFYP